MNGDTLWLILVFLLLAEVFRAFLKERFPPGLSALDTPGQVKTVIAFWAVWQKLVADPALAALDFRIETDRPGQMIMSPPPAPSHGNKRSEICFLLRTIIRTGKVVSECPVSTSDGVKAVDVAQCSAEKQERFGSEVCFLRCPEICIEVWSTSNTWGELSEKKRPYFEAGAEEVWIASPAGEIAFFNSEGEIEDSALCPAFPPGIEL